jgi:acetyltransferase-like isoleucine patch superfamily enzyme
VELVGHLDHRTATRRNPVKPWRKVSLVCRRQWLRGQGVVLGANCTVGARVVADPGAGRIEIGSDSSLETGVVLASFGGRISVARWVFVGPYTVIYGHGGVSIGEGTLISMHCRILSSNHTVPPLGIPIRSQPDILLPTKIGRDVWLGAGVTVLGGVTIGDGCVVGAGAVVAKDLPAGSVALGIPAVVSKQRPARDAQPG